MKVIVNKHDIEIIKTEDINEKESNIQEISFEFSEEYKGFAKYALITDLKNKTTKYVVGTDNKITMPVFEEQGSYLLGLYAEKTVDDKLYRLNPSPKWVVIEEGSLKDAENHQEITPSEFEQYMQLLNNGLQEVEKKLTDSLKVIDEEFKEGIDTIDNRLKTVEGSSKTVKQIGETVSKQGLEAEKQGDYAKEKADEVVNANNQAKAIISKFDSDFKNYTDDFNKNTSNKLEDYNNNHQDKMNEYNLNSKSKVQEYNDNHKSKMDEFNNNSFAKTKDFDDNASSKTTNYDINADNKIETFNQNAQDKTTDFNTNASNKQQEYDENAEDKVREFNENVDSLQENIIINRDEIRELFESLPSEKAKGSYITVKDSAKSPLKAFKSPGVLKQETTRGYQILNLDENYPLELYGVTVVKNTDGSITLNGTLTLPENQPGYNLRYNTGYDVDKQAEMSGKTYTLLIKTKGTGALRNIGLKYQGNSDRLSILNIAENTEYKKTDVYSKLESDTGKLYFTSFILNGTVFSNFTIWPLIYEGEEDDKKVYEPFTNGPSPNPEYSQEIEVLEGSLKVAICNKNIAPLLLTNGIYRLNEDIRVNESITLNTFNRANYIQYKENDSIIVKGNCGNQLSIDKSTPICKQLLGKTIHIKNDDNKFNWLVFYDKNLTEIKTYQTFKSSTNIVIPENTETFFMKINASNNEEVIENVMITLDTIEDFEQHLENSCSVDLKDNFVGKIDNTEDRIKTVYNENDNKYHLVLEKRIGRYVFDGSADERWSKVTCTEKEAWNGTENYSFRSGNILSDSENVNVNSLQKGFSNLGILNKPQRQVATRGFEGIALGNQSLAICNHMLTDLTIQEFRELLLENNIIVYYKLANPYEVDLGPIDMPKNYKGITHIYIDSELQPNIEVEYVIDPKLYIDNILSELATQQLAIEEPTMIMQTNKVNEIEEIIVEDEIVEEIEKEVTETDAID